jgi:hypothetical protein
LTVSPTTALIIVGSDCNENRIVYDSSAADTLLAPPNNGTSKWLPLQTNCTVAPNATRIGIVQALVKYVGVIPVETEPLPDPTPNSSESPEPNPSPSPEPTKSNETEPSPTTTKACEACEMVVTSDDEWHFKVTDGTSQAHYVECYLCALNLIKHYETLHIVSFCDWYGPAYPITVYSTGYGTQVSVTPTSAMVLNSGMCDGNRVAYNQTAADALKTDYSQYTSLLQQHEWLSPPTVMTISEAVAKFNPNSARQDSSPVSTILPIAAGLSIATVATILAFVKLRKK